MFLWENLNDNLIEFKLELLDNKHFQDMVFQLKRLLGAKYLVFSPLVKREKNILVLLSLCIF